MVLPVGETSSTAGLAIVFPGYVGSVCCTFALHTLEAQHHSFGANFDVLARISMGIGANFVQNHNEKPRFFHPKVVRWGSNFQGLQYYRAGQLLNIWRWLDKFNGTSGFENLLFCANFVGCAPRKSITPPFLEQFPQLRPNWPTKNISPILIGFFLKERYESIVSRKITQTFIPTLKNTVTRFRFFN